VTIRKQCILIVQAVLMKQANLSNFFISEHSLLILIICKDLALQVVRAVHITGKSKDNYLLS